jgi:uncharacterized membrane protein
MNPNIFAHEILCAALFFTMFCRAVKTDSKIKADVRFAFFILGIVSCMGMAAPIAWGYQPTLYEISLLGAVVLVQTITSHHWRQEVPYQFVKTEYRTMRRRRASDSVGTHV